MAIVCQKVLWHFLVLQNLWVYGLATSSSHNATLYHVSITNNSAAASQQSPTSADGSPSKSQTKASQSTSSTAAHGMGDFIAMGLGMSATDGPSLIDTSTVAMPSNSSTPSIALASYPHRESTQSHTSIESQQSASNSTVLPMSSSSIKASSHTGHTNSSILSSGYVPTAEQPLPTTSLAWSNESLTFSGDCWDQWSQWWDVQYWPQRVSTVWISTSTSTWTSTIAGGEMYMSTSTFLSSYTTTVSNGRFPITTYSTLAPITEYDWHTHDPTTTYTTTGTETQESYSAVTLSLQPSCVLPDRVSQCQESWNYYIDQETTGPRYETWGPTNGPPGCNPSATTMIPLSCRAAISSWESSRTSYNSKQYAPKCLQATVPDDYCSSARSSFLADGEKRGFNFADDHTTQSTATTVNGTLTSVEVWPSTALVGRYDAIAGCTVGCGDCAMQGETVELIYWPPATSLANVTHVGPWTVETLGTTLTSPTVYISFDTLWAKNSCSKIGRTIENAIVAITKTEDMSSLYGIAFRAGGRPMSASFNFTDLYHDPTPESIYQRQPRCWISSRAAQGGRYRSMPANYTGCARTEPYEPILVIPNEVRALDSAWEECRGGIEGVYDPPLALTPTDAIVVPTKSEKHTVTSPAAPVSDPFSNPPPETSKVQTPSPKPTNPPKLPASDPAKDPIDDPTGHDPKETSKPARGSGGNVWPLPTSAFDYDEPDFTNALSILRSAQASAEAAQIAASLVADAAKHQSSGSQDSSNPIGNDRPGNSDPSEESSGLSEPVANDRPGDSNRPEVSNGMSEPGGLDHPDGTDRTEDSNDPVDKGGDASLGSEQLGVVWTQGSEIFTAIRTDSSIVVNGAGAATTIAAGDEGMLNDQAINVPLEVDSIKINGEALSLSPVGKDADGEEANKQAEAVFTEAGQAFTAIVQGSSLVLQADGTTTTMALGAQGVLAGQTVSLLSTESHVIKVNGELITMEALDIPSNARSPASAVWTQDGETFTARMQSGSAIILEASGTTTLITASSAVTLGGRVFSVPAGGDVLVHDGTSITLDRAAPTDSAETTAASEEDGTPISAFDAGNSVVLVVGDKTVTLADGAQTTLDDQIISAGATGGVVVDDGTTTRTLSVQSTTSLSPESRISGETEESATATTDVRGNASAMSLSMPTVILATLLGLVAVAWT